MLLRCSKNSKPTKKTLKTLDFWQKPTTHGQNKKSGFHNPVIDTDEFSTGIFGFLLTHQFDIFCVGLKAIGRRMLELYLFL